jgi:membrane-bound lytic murein transglycosylase D
VTPQAADAMLPSSPERLPLEPSKMDRPDALSLARATLGALALCTLVTACGGVLSSGPTPATRSGDSTRELLAYEDTVDLAVADSFAATDADSFALEDTVADQDESLLQKILRTHPDLAELEDLYVEGGAQYFEGDLDLAEEYFFLLQDRIAEAHDSQPDSLAVLYVESLNRKLTKFIEILGEERFFSESYAPVSQSLADAYDSLRAQYGLPEFMMPEMPEPSSFETELLAVDNPKVEKWIKYFTGRGRRDFQRWLDRKARKGWIIENILEEEDLPRELVYMSLIESGLNPTVRSRAAAVGYWQFVRSTARNRGLKVNEWIDERHDIELSTRAAAHYLKLLHGMFQSWPLALAGYNSGEYRIQRAIGLQGDPDYWDLRLPRETRDYVPKFIAAVRIGEHPEQYGFHQGDADTLRFDAIEVNDTFGFEQIAKAGGFDEKALEELNPQLLAQCTPPGIAHYRLRVPVGTGDRTEAALEKIPESQRITWRKHKLRRGETLGQLARRFRTSVRSIMDLNGIHDARRVRAGRVLTIPYPRGGAATSPTRVASAGPRTRARADQKTIRYHIRGGDTLSTIAAAHHTSVSAIQRANGLRGHRIRAGQDLWIHVSKDNPAPAAKLALAGGSTPSTHTVRRGDTLSQISRRYGIALSDLLGWNSLRPSSTIRPGDRLRLMPPETTAPR